MSKKYNIPEELNRELVKLLGEEGAEKTIEEYEGKVSALQWVYFQKKFKKQFGLDVRVVFLTFGVAFVVYGILSFLNG
ncbi:MAG: hypothetical protein ACQESX_01205 [Bacteroidota bacterium]